VFVRPLSMDEGRKLERITRTAKNPVRLRRAIVVMMSGLWGSRTPCAAADHGDRPPFDGWA